MKQHGKTDVNTYHERNRNAKILWNDNTKIACIGTMDGTQGKGVDGIISFETSV